MVTPRVAPGPAAASAAADAPRRLQQSTAPSCASQTAVATHSMLSAFISSMTLAIQIVLVKQTPRVERVGAISERLEKDTRSSTHLGAFFFAAAFARGAWASASESEMLTSEELLCVGRRWFAAAAASSIFTAGAATGCADAAAGRDGSDAPDSFSLMTGALGLAGDAGDGCCSCDGGCCCSVLAMGCRGCGESSSEPDEEVDSGPAGATATPSDGLRTCWLSGGALPPGAGLELRDCTLA